MKHDDIVKILAPCGLNCMKCQMYADGDIKQAGTRRRGVL